MIYKILAKRKKKVGFHNTDQYRFYIKYGAQFASVLSYYHFSLAETQPFRIIQANIIIKAMLNKTLIESNLEQLALEATQCRELKEDEYIKQKVWELLENNNSPYLKLEKSRVYIPIFSRSLNLIYNEECSKILEYPYNDLTLKPKSSCVDLFDTYGLDLYKSPFTSLILIREDKTSAAFYEPDLETIYIINDQGRLDLEIPLYDRYMKKPEQHRVIAKLENVVDYFYSNDYVGFVKSLFNNKFISKKTYSYLRYKMSMNIIRQDKIYSKGKDSDEVL